MREGKGGAGRRGRGADLNQPGAALAEAALAPLDLVPVAPPLVSPVPVPIPLLALVVRLFSGFLRGPPALLAGVPAEGRQLRGGGGVIRVVRGLNARDQDLNTRTRWMRIGEEQMISRGE